MKVAEVVASRSTCDRKHVGAVVVRDKIILSTGYNGSLRGLVVAARRPAKVVRCEVDLEATRRSNQEIMAERTLLVMTNTTYRRFVECAGSLNSCAHLTFLSRSDEVSLPARGAS